MLQKKLAIALVFLMAASTAYGARAEISHLGYHPSQDKQVVVYDASSGSFDVKQNGNTVYSGILQQATCQGGQTCAIGDFSGFTSSGTFNIVTSGTQTRNFRIDSNIYQDILELEGEFFLALKQQGSPYHADVRGVQDPAFPMMADGSFIMTTPQAAITAIRLARAIERNPQLLSFDNHHVISSGTPDMAEYLRIYIDQLEEYQDHNGNVDVPSGWFYDFSCSIFENDPYKEKYMTSSDPCMIWNADSNAENAANALLAYTSAIPAIYQYYGEAEASSLLARAQSLEQHTRNLGMNSDDMAYYGAALFQLYDYTGNLDYLQRAYNLRGSIQGINSGITRGAEFYWEEYVRHKSELQSNDLEYNYDGADPVGYFTGKLNNDWNGFGVKHAISATGEKVYVIDIQQDFQHSRAILIEGTIAAKARELTSTPSYVKTIMDNQLSFLTGMNSIQSGDGAGEKSSWSFIIGIGRHPRDPHWRITWPHFFPNGNVLPNGADHLPGWIPGPLDSFNDGDKIFNFDDNWNNWRYTETTNEIVATAVELAAHMDGQYNNRARLARPKLSGDPGPIQCFYNGNTYDPGETFPQGDGCNTCTCQSDGTVSCTDNICEDDPVCGNGIVESGEQCDDSNTISGDGCSSTCQLEESDGCFSTVENAPASCTGSLTKDEFTGCRIVECSSASGSLVVLACDKPDSATPEYFEMYNQGSTGTPPEICLGDTCMDSEGYLKSSAYPICTDDPDPGAVCGNDIIEEGEKCDDGNTISGDGCSSTCQLEDGDACYSSLENIPAECTGATITEDSFNGCRTIVCGTLEVLACEKPNYGAREYFEMYKQTNSQGVEICLGGTCIADNGFAQSGNYPICIGEEPNPGAVCGNGIVETGEQCDDSNTISGDGCSSTCQLEESDGAVKLRVADWYPQGLNVVFVCEADAAQYSWQFGDGHSQSTTTDNVYHTYPSAGTYIASCQVSSGQDNLEVTVK